MPWQLSEAGSRPPRPPPPPLLSARTRQPPGRARGGRQRGGRMEDGFSSYSSLYDTSSLLQFCNGEDEAAAGSGEVPASRRGGGGG